MIKMIFQIEYTLSSLSVLYISFMKLRSEIVIIGILSILISLFGTMAYRMKKSEETAVEPSCQIITGESIYLAIGESYVFESSVSCDSEMPVIEVNDNTITGTGKGTVTVEAGCISHEVRVSDLYTIPQITEKEYLPCDYYSVEENEYLDEVLSYLIDKAGYQTRAGVVEAARFLLLRFPFKLHYFYENGRLDHSDYTVDGEGRYYHQGLYLNEEKTREITDTLEGPACWGCTLFEDATGSYTDNGLDCSGFISWALYNAGYDCGDLGAGPSPDIEDLSNLGKKIPVWEAEISQIKAGDLVGSDGHIGIVIGMDGENIFVGEAYWVKDLQVRIYSYEEFLNESEWEYVIDMDDYYGSMGNYTEMWK